jgi:iron(III) transport system substrate-binding protein
LASRFETDGRVARIGKEEAVLHRKKALLVFAAIALLAQATVCRAADWQQQWNKVVAAARKEGGLTLYGGYNVVYRDYNAQFEKKFPGLHVQFVQGSGNQLAVRIMSERRVNKFLADVVMGGSSTFQGYPEGTFETSRSQMILPEVSDESAWFGGHFSFVDAWGKYVISSQGSLGQELAYNTSLVDPDKIKSWKDFLDPKWKGKILFLNHNSISDTFIFFYNHPDLGPGFIKRLFSDAQIKQTLNLRQGVDWLANGRYQIYMDGTPQAVDNVRKQGLPVALFPSRLAEGEIMTGSYCCVAVLNKAPHPNAAKVFLNWILSREGQIEWQKISKKNSLRTDIPKDGIPPEIIPKPDGHYFDADYAKYHQPKDIKAIKKLIEDGLNSESD